ncbi:MAG: cytoplasmic protein [Acidobacteria bacterium]|nr:cytoplasmic protein [Acidobacteriota bacterium]
MNDQKLQPLAELKLDDKNLYREEVFTDLRVGSLKQLTPVTTDGSRDLGRPMAFVAETQLMSQMGPLPVQTHIDAENLAAAIEAFPAAIQAAVEKMIEEVKELQRQEMSRIVVPGADTTSKIIGPK